MFRPHRSAGLTRRLGVAAAVSTLTLLAVACSSSTSPSTPAAAADSVRLSDQWIKAAESGMSAAFGVLENTGDRPADLVAASSPASATVEIHEVVADASGEKTMRPKAGGITIPAHGKAVLQPGGEHLMFMNLVAPLKTGAETPLTLIFSDGSTATVTAQVRDFAGGKENYSGTPTGDKAAHGG